MCIIELTVPWEDVVEEADERNSLKYSKLAVDAKQCGWKTKVCPVEVGCRGFVGDLSSNCLRNKESEVNPNGKLSRPFPVSLNKRVDGSGLRGGNPSGPHNNRGESRGGHNWDTSWCR